MNLWTSITCVAPLYMEAPYPVAEVTSNEFANLLYVKRQRICWIDASIISSLMSVSKRVPVSV